MPNDDKWPPIVMAAVGGSEACLNIMLELDGANINQPFGLYDLILLHIAASQPNLKLVQHLLHRKAKVNSLDKRGQSPIFQATSACNDSKAEQIVLYLLEKGADPSM